MRLRENFLDPAAYVAFPLVATAESDAREAKRRQFYAYGRTFHPKRWRCERKGRLVDAYARAVTPKERPVTRKGRPVTRKGRLVGAKVCVVAAKVTRLPSIPGQ